MCEVLYKYLLISISIVLIVIFIHAVTSYIVPAFALGILRLYNFLYMCAYIVISAWKNGHAVNGQSSVNQSVNESIPNLLRSLHENTYSASYTVI